MTGVQLALFEPAPDIRDALAAGAASLAAVIEAMHRMSMRAANRPDCDGRDYLAMAFDDIAACAAAIQRFAVLYAHDDEGERRARHRGGELAASSVGAGCARALAFQLEG